MFFIEGSALGACHLADTSGTMIPNNGSDEVDPGISEDEVYDDANFLYHYVNIAEIPFNSAVSGDENTEWKDAIYRRVGARTSYLG